MAAFFFFSNSKAAFVIQTEFHNFLRLNENWTRASKLCYLNIQLHIRLIRRYKNLHQKMGKEKCKYDLFRISKHFHYIFIYSYISTFLIQIYTLSVSLDPHWASVGCHIFSCVFSLLQRSNKLFKQVGKKQCHLVLKVGEEIYQNCSVSILQNCSVSIYQNCSVSVLQQFHNNSSPDHALILVICHSQSMLNEWKRKSKERTHIIGGDFVKNLV